MSKYISKKNREALYRAIREEIVDVRIKLKLSPKDDYILAQVESSIWARQKETLGIIH
jgi:ribonuclease HII